MHYLSTVVFTKEGIACPNSGISRIRLQAHNACNDSSDSNAAAVKHCRHRPAVLALLARLDAVALSEACFRLEWVEGKIIRLAQRRLSTTRSRWQDWVSNGIALADSGKCTVHE